MHGRSCSGAMIVPAASHAKIVCPWLSLGRRLVTWEKVSGAFLQVILDISTFLGEKNGRPAPIESGKSDNYRTSSKPSFVRGWVTLRRCRLSVWCCFTYWGCHVRNLSHFCGWIVYENSMTAHSAKCRASPSTDSDQSEVWRSFTNDDPQLFFVIVWSILPYQLFLPSIPYKRLGQQPSLPSGFFRIEIHRIKVPSLQWPPGWVKLGTITKCRWAATIVIDGVMGPL